MSSSPCGCDPEAKYVCRWHDQRGYDKDMISPADLSTKAVEACPSIEYAGSPNEIFYVGLGPMRKMRTFHTGATRDTDDTKPDYEGYLSPLVLERFGVYMTQHRLQADGSVRGSDNRQKGMPLDVYIKSAFRHFMDWWREQRREPASHGDLMEDAICALLFNVQGYLFELLKAKRLG